MHILKPIKPRNKIIIIKENKETIQLNIPYILIQ